ncbi:MAG: DUF973 family protein [Thermoplasmata archaeon]|jgi:hypothetical protein
MSTPPPNAAVPIVTVPPPPPPPPPGGFGAPRSLTGAEREGLRKISNGAVIGVVGAVVNLIIAGALDVGGFTRALFLESKFSAWQSWIWVIVALALGIVFTLIELTWMRDGLRRLPGPSPELAGPLSLSRLMYPGLILLFVGLVVLLGTIGSVLTCTPSGMGPAMATCVRTGALWPILAGAGLSVIGGILTVVGWIFLGIGIWRLERRYHQSLIQVGAVLLVLFPLLGNILIWVGLRQVQDLPTAPSG